MRGRERTLAILTLTAALGGLLSSAPAMAREGAGCQDPESSAAVAPTAVALAPLPGHTTAEAHGINASGEIAGVSRGNAHPAAVIWDKHGRPRALAPLPGHYASEAFAISPSGEVVGDSYGAGSTAVHWDRLGIPRPLRPLDGDIESSARAISAFGWVAGFSVRRSGGAAVITAVVWDRSRRARPLALPEGFKEALALGINLRGQVAGFGVGPDGLDKALRWNSKGEATLLPALRGSIRGEAHAIDEGGLVAGDSGSATVDTGALWGGQVKDRQPLPGDSDSEALALNGSGEVVGTSSTAQVDRAVLWGVGGDPIHLPPLPGHTDAHAFGINASGTVVGVSIGEKAYSAVVWKTRQCAVFPVLAAPAP